MSGWIKIPRLATRLPPSRPDVLALSPQAFVDHLASKRIKAFHFAYDAKSDLFHLSHPELLTPVVQYLLADPIGDWAGHEAVFVRVSPEGVLQSASIQYTYRGAGAGGVRNWSYPDTEGFLRDGIRLAKGMGAKNALAGLWWGGGKGVMASNSGTGLGAASEPQQRAAAYRSYGRLVSSLRGAYVTAEDVGTNVKDMEAVFSGTRHTTCIPERLGGSGNPSIPTARGIVVAIEAAFEELGIPLAGARVGVIGVGNVGSFVARFLLEKGVGELVCSDGNEATLSRVGKVLRSAFPSAKIELHTTTSLEPFLAAGEQNPLDCLSPCATGGLLNPTSIPQLNGRVRIICGAANNQLLNIDSDGELLHEAGIVYLPDFAVNRMGIVNCANEYAGTLPPLEDPAIIKHFIPSNPDSIPAVARFLITESKKTGRSTQAIADERAAEKAKELNPLWGHRSFEIIKAIVEPAGPGRHPKWIDYLEQADTGL
ncbi:hypothetical protein DFJ74DRAFT_765953 [Hyaloraphidium curvatum]|nr:hypothetical protein DFJ74DRAFT_765953 [Hyaloraphidium curvatum]